MARVPIAAGPNVLPTVGGGPAGARVATPEIVMGDFRMRQPAALQARDASLPRVGAKVTPYKPDPGLTPDTGAQTMARFGQALGAAGDAAGRIVLDVQMQANALMADQAVNKAKETALRLAYDKAAGFTALKGFDALNRPNGKALADEYAERFDEQVKTLAGELKNDAQRAAFSQQALGIRTSLYSQATQHETQEFRTYNLSVQEGTIKVETDNVGLNYKEPDAVNQSVERIKGAVAEQGFALGKSHQWIEAAQKDAVSKAHSTALASALEDGNVVFADAYMRRHKDDMTADDVLRVRGVITKEMDGRMALEAAREAVGAIAPDFEPSELTNLHGVVKKLETGSGSGFNRDGSMVQGPKTKYGTAKGPMQVLDGTNKKPGFGVKPAKDDSPEERTRVGRDYIDAMVKRYDGNAALALAAYNWGPGNVDDAIKALKRPENVGKSWLDLAPAETKNYVKNGLAALGAGAGRPATPTLADALARLDADPRVNSSPTRLQAARAEVTARFNALAADKKAREEDTMATALRAVEQNGGNYLGLPPSLRAAIPADKIDTVMSFADKVRGGNTVTNLAVYQRLTDDRYLRSLNDSQFFALRTELSPSDFQHFADARKATGGGQAPGDLNTPALAMVVQNRLQTLGIDPTPPDKDKAGQARVGAVNKFIREQVLIAQQQHGKKFNDLETEAFVDGLFNKSVAFRSMVFGIENKSSQRLLEMTVKDIPQDDVKAIRDAFKKRGVTEASDADILTAYWRTKSIAGR